MKRGLVLCLCALAMSASAARLASAQQSVVLSLDIFYSNPDLPASSGGAWQLMATATGEGLAGVATTLDFASAPSTTAADLIFRANTGLAAETFKTTFDAKTWFTNTDNDATTLNMLFGQVPVAAPGPQILTYDVGGTATLNPDELRGTAPNQVDTTGVAMANAVILAIGRFNAGDVPVFAPGSAANVFTAIPASPGTNPPAVGTIVAATVTTQVRDNENTLSGDVNLDKTVAAADIGIALPNLNAGNMLWQNGDINGDHVVAAADLGLLLPKLNQTHPAAAAAGAVPEPGSFALAAGAVLGLASIARRRHIG